MSRLPNEDLFEGSKMTFGEHLEELRVVLFRSMLGLAIGVVFGFMFAGTVIDVVVTPLEKALKEFYLDKAVEEVKREFGSGLSSDELTELDSSIRERGLIFEYVQIERTELKRMLDVAASGDETLPAELVAPASPTLEFVPFRLWRDTSNKIISTDTTEGFLSWMKVGIISGLTLAMPWIFWNLWVFVAEGLYPTEKKYVYLYLPFSLLLFVAGASLAYFFVFEPVLKFLLSFNDTMNSEPNLKISEWLSFFLLLPLGFGVGFQLPLVMLFLNRVGVVTVDVYISQWRIAILIIFVAAMFLTPSDPQSMMLLAIPLTILYFLGILLCKYLPKRQSPFGEGLDPD